MDYVLEVGRPSRIPTKHGNGLTSVTSRRGWNGEIWTLKRQKQQGFVTDEVERWGKRKSQGWVQGFGAWLIQKMGCHSPTRTQRSSSKHYRKMAMDLFRAHARDLTSQNESVHHDVQHILGSDLLRTDFLPALCPSVLISIVCFKFWQVRALWPVR